MARFLYKTVNRLGDGDYTTLEACMNGNEQNLTGDGWFDVAITGDWSGGADTTACVIDGYTTTTADYINIYTSPEAKHNGKGTLDTGAYRHVGSWSTGSGVQVADNNVRVTGLQFKNTTTDAFGYPAFGVSDGTSNLVIDKCVFIAGTSRALRLNNYAAGTLVKNSISIITAGTFGTTDNVGPVVFYNCVMANYGSGGCYTNSFGGYAWTCVNCYGYCASGTVYNGDGTITIQNCASDDGSQSTTVLDYSTSSGCYFTSVTSGSEDFHLNSISSGLYGAGRRPSRSIGGNYEDIDGKKWETIGWSIGVDAYQASPILYKTVNRLGTGDYTTLEGCMNGNEQDLVTANTHFNVEITGDWSGGNDTSQCTIDGYTTDGTRFIHIYTNSDSFHGGKPDTSKYCLYRTTTEGQNLLVQDNYVKITGLFIKKAHASNFGAASATLTTGTNVLYNRCYWEYHNDYADNRNCLNASGANIAPIFINCVFWNSGTDGSGSMFTFDVAYDWRFYNCTAIDFDNNFDTLLAGGVFVNNISRAGNDDYGDTSHTKRGTFTTNAAFDTTGEIDSINPTFVDEANGDFHLISTDTDVIGVGTDYSGAFNDDIDGQLRLSGSNIWDCGADQYVSKFYYKGTFSSLPANDLTPDTEFTSPEYINVLSDDDITYTNQAGTGTEYVVILFKQINSSQIPCTITWDGQSGVAPSSKAVTLQIYDRDGTTWEDLDVENEVGADTDFTLTGTISSDLDHYYDSDNTISARVYQQVG